MPKIKTHLKELISLFIKVIWFHQFIDEPVLLYSELDQNRFEKRKVEIYRNYKIGIANDEFERHSMLGTFAVPELLEMNLDPEFYGMEISKEEFEIVWNESIKTLQKD
jgi:hypothetical protein